MSKLAIIEEEVVMCYDCPHLRFDGSDGDGKFAIYKCSVTNKVVDDMHEDIPDWCPLEDWDE